VVNSEQRVGNSEKSGGVLLVVLGVLAAMGVVVSLLASYALERSMLAETRGSESRSEVGSRLSGAIQAAVASLNAFTEVADGLHHPSEGWGRPAYVFSAWPTELDGIEVQIFDESSKAGLELLSAEQMESLLEEAGLTRGQAGELTDLLFDWMDPDDEERPQGRENRNIGLSRDPWVPNRVPLYWEEVWKIPEWSEVVYDSEGKLKEWAKNFSQGFSLEHDLPANINSVDRQFVEWMSDADLIPYPNWLDRRDGFDREDGSADDRVLTEMPGGDESMGDLFSADSQLFRIRAGIRVGGRFVWKEAWVKKSSEQGQGARSGGDQESQWGSWELVDVRKGLSLVLDEQTEEE